LVDSVRRYHDCTKRFTKPVFPGYVFTEIPPTSKNRVYQQDLLVRAIWVDDQELFLRQMADVRAIVNSGMEAVLQPLIKKGARVKIISGALRGVEGFVEDPKNPRGVLIAMDVLQQGLLVPVSLENLEVLP